MEVREQWGGTLLLQSSLAACFQYVSEVVIGAPYAVTADLLDHFRVSRVSPIQTLCTRASRGAKGACPCAKARRRRCVVA